MGFVFYGFLLRVFVCSGRLLYSVLLITFGYGFGLTSRNKINALQDVFFFMISEDREVTVLSVTEIVWAMRDVNAINERITNATRSLVLRGGLLLDAG